jgi:hypothetical protein
MSFDATKSAASNQVAGIKALSEHSIVNKKRKGEGCFPFSKQKKQKPDTDSRIERTAQILSKK